MSSMFHNLIISIAAPGDMMSFLEACAMGNLDRVEALLQRGVVRQEIV